MVRPPLEVAEIFRRYGPGYRREHSDSLSRAQLRVLSAIALCRTAALGGHVEQCDSCGHQRVAYNSCRHRACPKCQSLARAQWLEDRQAELLPTEYFHVVFTVPEEIAAIAYQNKKEVYGILFRAAAETLLTIAADRKHLGAAIGFLAVLHTWGQNLLHHPHLHCVVPGGGLSLENQGWVACRPGFFLPVRVLSRLFRSLFLSIFNKPSSPESSVSIRPYNISAIPRHSPSTWLRFTKPSGSCMPSRPSAVLSRCSTTWAVTPIAWLSPTTAC